MEQGRYAAPHPPSRSHMFQDATNFGIERSHLFHVQGNVNIASPMIPLEAPGKVKRIIVTAPEPAIFSEGNHYSSQLLYQGRGYPLYIPGPQVNLPSQYRRTGISIGDVGRVTPEGDFDFFFNIFRPANDPVNANVPENFEALSPYDPVDVAQYNFSPGNFVASSSIHETNGDFSEPTPGGQFMFSCQGPDGAVLALPHGSHLEKLRSLEHMRQYAAKNAESWYRYANETRGRGLENGSLYLVTGCEKARSWGMASFHDVPLEEEFPISFGPTTGVEGGYRYRWRGTRFRHKHADSPREDDTPLNQTTFIHAFAISLCGALWGFRKSAEICLADAPRSTRKWGDRVLVPFGSLSPASWWPFSFFGAVSLNAGTQRAAFFPCRDDLLSDAAPITKVFHPSQPIHQHILREVPKARVIITHDDDWGDVFRDVGQRMTTAGLQQAIFSRSAIVEEDGVVFLHPKETKPLEHQRPSVPETPLMSSAMDAELSPVSLEGNVAKQLESHGVLDAPGVPHKRTFLIKVLSPLLFLGPDSYLDNLRDICTDGLIHSRIWPKFISRLSSEWQEFTTYSTILLNANVGFLSIQSVDQGGNLPPGRSAAQIASYLSILISIGSVLLGLILIRQHRDRVETAREAADLITRRKHRIFGLESTAILYSLPYSMLIWSMVSFIAACALTWLQDSDHMKEVFVGVLAGVIPGLIFWFIFAVCDREGRWWDWERLQRRLGLTRIASHWGRRLRRHHTVSGATT
ncbi:hypothetical protein FB45DRAFT_128286 [Roridomyces roridus]|uniref:Uncharacterized protein n=1 Tax=Roridomyces roridus TaxID=1738132 RepID=A0AAD7AXU2_9AGAR|nr:hypothetical protein FB45DRAFT_128286 [Roridomyces roridus]